MITQQLGADSLQMLAGLGFDGLATILAVLLPMLGPLALGAVTVANLVQGNDSGNLHISTVIADADADVAATITHNLNIPAAELTRGNPKVILEENTAAGRLSDWIVTSKTANTVVLGATNAVGSGAAPIQLHVRVERPHSILND